MINRILSPTKKERIKYIFILVFPIIIENILHTLLGTTDTFFAGKLADEAIAGMGVTNLVMNIFISFYTAVGIGATAIVSRNHGEKDYRKTTVAIIQSLFVGIALGILVGVICFLFNKQILAISGANKSIVSYALPYYFIIAVPSIFLCLQLILSSCLRAIKDTKTPMYITAVSNILNIILNITFINLGMGILGLGLATTLARAISVLLLFLRIQRHDKNIHFLKIDFVLNKAMIKNILFIGIPAGTIENYSYIPSMGFGLAVATLVGSSLGEKNPQQAKKLTYTSYVLSAICMTAIGIIFYVFAPQLASLFTATVEVQKLIVDVLRIIAFFQPFSALVQIMTNALQGAGDTKFPMYSTLLGIWASG